MSELFQIIKDSYDFIGKGTDTKGNPYTFWNYSITIQAFPSEVDQIRKHFTTFKVTHLFLNYYIVGFNKTS